MNYEQTIAFITQRIELAKSLRDDYRKYYFKHSQVMELEMANKYYRWYREECSIIDELQKLLEYMKGGENYGED